MLNINSPESSFVNLGSFAWKRKISEYYIKKVFIYFKNRDY